MIAEFCPHRGASLYFGRNEEGGMRCAYHGWKFALDGQCVEMPSEPSESSFAAKVCHTAYSCVERGGVIGETLALKDHDNPARQSELPRNGERRHDVSR